MEHFTPWSALAGGTLIGLSATLLLWSLGHVAGISGIAAGIIGARGAERTWRGAFLAGLVGGAALWAAVAPGWTPPVIEAGLPLVAVAGFLVGLGTRIGSGCTSGHGICGLARLSPRSLVAVPVFLATAMLTVYVVRHAAA